MALVQRILLLTLPFVFLAGPSWEATPPKNSIPLARPALSTDSSPEPSPVKGPKATPERPDASAIDAKEIDSVLLITVDTLRADVLGIYGHPRDPLPIVSSWAERGVTFERAFATSSWTVPSLASLLTSLYPSSHGAVHGIRQADGIRGQESIPARATTLGEAMREAGFNTFAVTSNPHLAAQFGFQRGFQRYSNLNRAPAPAVTEQLARWKRNLDKAPKAFLWLHFFDPHLPYTPSPGALEALEPGISGRRISESRLQETQALLKELRRSLGVAAAREEPAARFQSFRSEIQTLYEIDISRINGQIEAILEEFPRFRQGLICFSADHGEEFLEHGYLGHGFNLHHETVRVPLVLVHPNLPAGHRIAEPFSQVDLAPTLLALVDGKPPESWAGRKAYSPGGRWKGNPSPVIAEVSRFELKKPQGSLLEGDFKLIVTGDDPRTGSNPLAAPTRLELFDLRKDPGEHNDIAREQPRETERMYRQLLQHLSAAPQLAGKPEKLVISSETLKALKALGYLQ